MSSSLVAIVRRRMIAVVVLVTTLNILFVAAYYGSDIDALHLEGVDGQLAKLAESLGKTPEGDIVFSPSASTLRIYTAYPQSYGFRLSHRDGRVLHEMNPSLLPPPKSEPFKHDGTWLSDRGADLKLLSGSRLVRLDGQEIEITFSGSSDPAHLTLFVFLDELLRHVVVPLLPFAAILTIVNIVTVRRALAPLMNAANAAHEIATSSKIGPLPTAGLTSEVRDLVDATNTALARLAESLEAERAFAAEAAHALRTPLAILTARLAQLPPGEISRSIIADVKGVTRLTSQLLSVAQADTLIVPRDKRCDLAEVARDVVSRMAAFAIDQGRSLALVADRPVEICGDFDALAHAARNLVENALRFAPQGTEVVVTVTPDGCLEVADQGPGIADELKPRVTERFWRSSEAGKGGTGLGLAIAARVAAAHGGELRFADRKGGGTRAQLWLSPIRLTSAA